MQNLRLIYSIVLGGKSKFVRQPSCMWRGVSSNGDLASASSLGGSCQCDTVAGHAKAGARSRQIRGVIARKWQSERGSTKRAAMGWDATRGSEPEEGLDAAEHEQAAS